MAKDKKAPPSTPLLARFDLLAARSGFDANRWLRELLFDDRQRALLYAELNASGRVLDMRSRADPAPTCRPEVYLLAQREHVERALTDGLHFGNQPYQTGGRASFMLALDGDLHAAQREFAAPLLRYQPFEIAALCQLAFEIAAVLPLKQPEFDGAEFAEQVALRFTELLFGFPTDAHVLLMRGLSKAYDGLLYQILGRHFVTAPNYEAEAVPALGALLIRSAALVDDFAAGVVIDDVELVRQQLAAVAAKLPTPPANYRFSPVCERLALAAHPGSGRERAAITTGLIAGLVGNVQASVSIALSSLLASGDLADDARLPGRVAECLRLNPPAAFLQRKVLKTLNLGGTELPAGSIVVLAMGAAMQQAPPSAVPPGVFGAVAPPPAGPGPAIHDCIGQYLALPLVQYTVRRLVGLPGLDWRYDALSGAPLGLEKRWGSRCLSLPLQYRRAQRLRQQPLSVIMPIKQPLAEHAEKLKLVIQYGAPRIEFALRDSRHVHFAWFVLVENDTKLALLTCFDGDFDAYLEHFVLKVGSLFDRLLEHIEGAPPMPTASYPKEFVETIKRYHADPVGGYFFSAYPQLPVSDILNQVR